MAARPDRDRAIGFALTALALIAPFDVVVGPSTAAGRVMLRPGPVLALVVALWGSAHLLRDRQRLRRRPLLVATVVAWIGFVWLSVLVSSDRLTGAGGALRVTTVGLLALVVASVVGDAPNRTVVARRLFGGIVVGAGLGAIVGLVVLINDGELLGTQHLHGSITEIGGRARLTRPWTHANVAAMALGAALPLAVSLAHPFTSTLTRGLRSVSVLAVPLIAVAGAATLSRGFAVGLIAVFCVALTLRPDRGRVAALAVAAACVGAMLVATPGWSLRSDGTAATDRGAEVSAPGESVLDGGSGTAAVVVHNNGAETWPAVGDGRVEISARWLSVDDPPIVLAEQRWPLPADVAPGEEMDVGLDFGLEAPVSESVGSVRQLPDGSYRVLWDLLIDQEAYLLQFAGESAPGRGIVRDSEATEVPVGRALVAPQQNIGRSMIWRIALDRFGERPLLGVGPNQLGAASVDDIETDQRFPGQHAHNLVLEPLATWGTIGTVPFILLIGGAALGSWRRARRRVNADTHAETVGDRSNALDRATVLSLAAIICHGAVDWHLGFTSLGIPVAIVVGVAWSRQDVA